MGGEVLIMISMFLVLFGIAYLHYSTRNKERLALIEKGMDAGIFKPKSNRESSPVWKIIILNLSLLLIGIGFGILITIVLESLIVNVSEGIYPGVIFLMAGVGLLVGFFMTKKFVN